jgi:hypothetical protein
MSSTWWLLVAVAVVDMPVVVVVLVDCYKALF